jgi:thioredoxin 1
MKKLQYLAASALTIFALASCSNSSAESGEQQDADAQATEQAAQAPAETLDSSSLQTGIVNEINDDNLLRPDKAVSELIVLDFSATWCGPCQALKPVFADAAQKYSNVKFASIDIDQNEQTKEAYGIESIPTVIFLVPGQGPVTFVGTQDLLPADKFEALVEKYSK